MESKILSNKMRAVVSQIWELTLRCSAKEVPSSEFLSSGESSYVGRVHISGEWEGELFVRVEEDFAQQVAARMFYLEDSETPSSEQIEDALREITNMAGGNLKSTLPEPSLLGLPVVEKLSSQRADCYKSSGNTLFDLAFESEFGSVQVFATRGGEPEACAIVP